MNPIRTSPHCQGGILLLRIEERDRGLPIEISHQGFLFLDRPVAAV